MLKKSILQTLKTDNKGLQALRLVGYIKSIQYPVINLLSKDNNKTKKGEKYGYLTYILYLAPANISGYEFCTSRTKGCTISCLFTSGHGRYSNVKIGRLRKTYQLLFRTDEFYNRLVWELENLTKKAKRANMTLAVRLNGTADIDWENIPIKDGLTVFELFPNVQFYDYTKRLNRLLVELPANYHLTFSLAETKLSQKQALKALKLDFNVAIVFRDKLPDYWNGYKVLDGDLHDLRFTEGHNEPIIVGLKAKGKARYDKTGFVIDPNLTIM